MFGQTQAALRTWRQVRQQLSQDYTVQTVGLSTGQVPPEVNVLVIVSPQGLDDRARFAIDQYLMRGGSVIVAAGNYSLSYDQFTGGLALAGRERAGRHAGALWRHGRANLVMGPQNEPFPVEVDRNVGGTVVRELRPSTIRSSSISAPTGWTRPTRSSASSAR